MSNKYIPLENLSYQKSNTLVSAKYKSSLIENQLMAIALTRIEVNPKDEKSPIVAKLYPGELKRLIGDPSNIYKTLKKVSKTMTGHTMFLEDGKGNFSAFAVVTNADYKNGEFIVEFNNRLRPHVLGLTSNFSTFEIGIMSGFSKNSSFRLYELLRSQIYRSKKEVNGGRVDVEYNISELRFMIGLANSDDPAVKNKMSYMNGNDIDWDLLYECLNKKDRKYEVWGDFARYVLKPAQKELKEKSNIRFEYQGISKKGRATTHVLFHVYPNKPTNAKEINEKEEFLEEKNRKDRQMILPRDLVEFRDLYETYVGQNSITPEDIDLLIQKSGYNKELVERAFQDAAKQEEIYNYMGWLLAYISSGGFVQTKTMNGSSEMADVVDSIRKDLNSKENKEKFWKKIKTKDDFQEFLSYEQTKGVTINELDYIYEPSEAVQEYIDWKTAIN